jgi:predicted nucleic acid-binding protein
MAASLGAQSFQYGSRASDPPSGECHVAAADEQGLSGFKSLWISHVNQSLARHGPELLCPGLHAHRPRPGRDAMIAASALEHRMTVVTRKVGDVAHAGVQVTNPWEAQP